MSRMRTFCLALLILFGVGCCAHTPPEYWSKRSSAEIARDIKATLSVAGHGEKARPYVRAFLDRLEAHVDDTGVVDLASVVSEASMFIPEDQRDASSLAAVTVVATVLQPLVSEHTERYREHVLRVRDILKLVLGDPVGADQTTDVGDSAI